MRISNFGLFGPSIAATWLYGQTTGNIFFVDEDQNTIGKKHFNLPIVSPESLGDNGTVPVGLIPGVAENILEKFKNFGCKFYDVA